MPYIYFFIISYIFVGPVFASDLTSLQDMVIRTDTTWSGNILIEGVVVVGRGTTLTIRQGTTIRFKKIDRNHDGIGDGEIRILGRILAEGRKDAPIRFCSAQKTPMALDWSYLLVFTSGGHNKIEYCRFENGFSGLQVHFSTVTVSDSWFINNNEGIRFGRAKITLDHNVFINNKIGIRFTRMEGPAEITNNIIRKNSVGIFLVPSSQNILDFFKPGRSGTAWNKGHLLISHNNIANNRQYNLKLGAKQQWDLNIAGNWWGSNSTEIIQKGIYDRQEDKELGVAIIQPIANNSFMDLGVR